MAEGGTQFPSRWLPGRPGALEAPDAETILDAVLRLDTHLLMVEDPAKWLDSMSMAWGLEVRVPLDQDLVDLMGTCPPALQAASDGRGILKKLGREMLPAALLDRARGYFPAPAVRHLDEPYLTMLRVALYRPKAKEAELLQPLSVEILRSRPNDHRTRTGANSFWVLRVLEMYLQARGIS